MKKYALFIGRWQTWHKGYEWLIEQQLKKGKNCWIAIRDVELDEDNTKSAQQVLKELQQEPFFTNNWDKIMISIIPDIESINYGITPAYNVIHHNPPKEIEQINGKSIKKKYIDSNGDEVIYAIDK